MGEMRGDFVQRFETTENKFESKMEDMRCDFTRNVEKSEDLLLDKMDKMNTRLSENMKLMHDNLLLEINNNQEFILDEIGRTQNYLENKIDVLQRNVEEMKDYCYIVKLESNNSTLILKMIEDISKRIEVLEQRTA